MSLEFRETVRRYIDLEYQIQEVVNAVCQPVCGTCTNCCCALRFCRESVDSHWLRTIGAVSGHIVEEYDEREGWLTPQGCRLKVGRPPVCYEYYCEAIILVEEDLLRRYSLKVLGRLVGFVGQKAYGNRHLITLSQFELQNRLQLKKLRKRLETTERIFSECQEILHTGVGRIDMLSPVLALPKERSESIEVTETVLHNISDPV